MLLLAQLLFVAVPLLLVYLLVELRYRRYHKYRGLPQAKPSFLWGNMKTIREHVQKLRPNEHFDTAFQNMLEAEGNPPIMLLDTWPVRWHPTVLVTSHDIAEQISRSSKEFPFGVPRSPTIREFRELFGEHSILTMKDDEWKTARQRLNPGFSQRHLMTFIPQILDKTDRFLAHLDSFARTGEDFSLEELCTNLTFDIIGAVTMDVDFQAQTNHRNEVMRHFIEIQKLYEERAQANSLMPHFLTSLFGLQRRIIKAGQRLDDVVRNMVRERFEESSSSSSKSRSVLALSLHDVKSLDNRLLTETADSLKTFLFAGHDTTSILLQWVFYELSRTPRAQRALRAELDHVFGAGCDPEAMKQRLLDPHGGGGELLRQLKYTSAVVKEALRLYPPGSAARLSPPGRGLVVRDAGSGGRQYRLDGLMLFVMHVVIQRDEAVYGPNAADFVPERWLGNTDTWESSDGAAAGEAEMKIPTSAWRPFERGPRNCIGQGLANLEARIIIALVARRYDFTKVGLGELERDDKGAPMLNNKGQYRVKSELYTTGITRRPIGGNRMRVALTPEARKSSMSV